MDKLKECFARLSEDGKIEPVNNEFIDQFVYGLIYLTEEIIDITPYDKLEDIKQQIKSIMPIINTLKSDLVQAMGNVLDNEVLKDNLDGLRILSKSFDDILKINIKHEELIEIMLGPKIQSIKKTLEKMLFSIKISKYDKSQFWSERILKFLGEE